MIPAARTTLAALAVLLWAGAAGGQTSSQITAQVQTNADKPQAAQSPQGGLNMGKHDTNAPINVASDNFIGNFDTKEGTYIGNVVVVQADYHLRSDTLKVIMLNGQPNKFYADGKVVFESASGIATGDHGIYDLNPPRTLTMVGNVVLTKQKDVMRGTQLVVNLVTGDSHMTARGMPANRVQSLFIPKPQPQKAGDKPSQTPQK
ncbi:MAG: LptA/OstA family protein [Rhizomicrobium sp.]|jgi:lipopolysaccharide export system protein LptA